MRKTFSRMICLITSLALSVLTLASCGKKYDTIYIEDENGDIAAGFNENMVSFHMTVEKTAMLVGMGSQTDIPELWTMTVGEYAKQLGMEPVESLANTTFDEFYTDSAVDSAKRIVVSSYLFDKMKGENTVAGKLLAAADKKVEAQVDNIISQLQITIGSKDDFESFISGMGITLEDLRKYYEMNQKMIDLKTAVDVSEDEKKAYFSDNYAIVKHILINTNSKTNDAGEKVALTPEEKQAELDKVKQIEARLNAGEDYETVFAEFDGTDPGTQIYTEGYFVTNDNKYMPEFQDAALSMKEGEIRTVYTDYGAHIMKKYPMDTEKYNAYSDIYNEITTTLTARAFNNLINPYLNKVNIDEKTVKEYSMSKVAMMQP